MTCRGPATAATSATRSGSGSADALKVWDAVWESVEGYGVLPFGLDALYMLRIEAGLLLLDVDFWSSRFAWTDEDRSTPIELGSAGCSATWPTTTGRSSAAAPSSASSPTKTSRWRLTGLIVDWEDYDRIYNEAGLIPPKDHTPIQEEFFVYDDDDDAGRLRHELHVLARCSSATSPWPACGPSSRSPGTEVGSRST